MSSVSQVIHAASDEARKAAAGAISCVCPIRPNGVCDSNCFRKSLFVESAGADSFCYHHTGFDGVDADFARTKFLSQCSCHCIDRPFCGNDQTLNNGTTSKQIAIFLSILKKHESNDHGGGVRRRLWRITGASST